jgi:carboxylesterase type B
MMGLQWVQDNISSFGGDPVSFMAIGWTWVLIN